MSLRNACLQCSMETSALSVGRAGHAVSLSGFEGYPQAPPAFPQAYPTAYAPAPAAAPRQYAVMSSDDDGGGYSPQGSF